MIGIKKGNFTKINKKQKVILKIETLIILLNIKNFNDPIKNQLLYKELYSRYEKRQLLQNKLKTKSYFENRNINNSSKHKKL